MRHSVALVLMYLGSTNPLWVLHTMSNAPKQRHLASTPPRRTGRSGQSLVEFSLVVPLMLLMVVAIADFGRLYVSAVAVESAAREAADFGAFTSDQWSPANVAVTTDEMLRRACVAAAGSHLEGYSEPTGTVGHSTCTNPSFSCTLEWGGSSVDCATSGGTVGTTDCSVQATEPPCIVHVKLDYEFRMILSFPPLPETITIGRESRFRMQDLTLGP
jgi:Flp pilus assembly protein TadG